MSHSARTALVDHLMKIISGTAHQQLAKDIATHLDTKLANVTVDCFPDGETYCQIHENVRGEDVFIVQPTCPATNHNIMEMLIMVDAAKRASAGRINAVMPFYGYARQDRKDKPRVPITAKLVANLISAAGVDRVVTMDLHAAQIQGFFDIPVDHLYARPVFIKHLRENCGVDGDNLVVVSPDVGGVKNARAYSDAFGAELAIVAKHRVSATKVEAMNVIGDVKGKDAFLIDDMTETGGTLCAAAKILKQNGAKRIFAGVSHAVIEDHARKRILESDIEELITTDSVPMAHGEKITPLSVAPLFGEAIRRIHNGESVTSLFDF